MILVFGGIKGGGGKTTLSTNTCVIRALEGKKVLLVDADDQGSASTWSEHRESLGIETSWTTISLSGPAVRTQVLKMQNNYDDIIIDVGGRDTNSQRAALTIADALIVPFQPKSFDVWTLGKLSELLEEALSINTKLISYGVINRGDPYGKDNEQAKEIIRKCGNICCLDDVVFNRKAFSNASAEGMGVVEMIPKDLKANEEMTALVRYIFDTKITV